MVRGRCLTCLPTLHMYETSQGKIRCWRGGHHLLFMSRSWESFERFRSLAEHLNCFNHTQASHHRLSTPSARPHPRSVTNSFVAAHHTSRNIRSIPSIFQGRGVGKIHVSPPPSRTTIKKQTLGGHLVCLPWWTRFCRTRNSDPTGAYLRFERSI